MTIPNLQTSRLKLTPQAEQHLPFRLELDSDLATLKYLGGRIKTSEEIVKAHQEQLDLNHSDTGLGYWVGYVDSVPIGVFILKRPYRSDSNADAELGYRLLPRFWGRGLASEGSKAVLDYAFTLSDIETVCGLTEAGNEGSWKTVDKIGMKYVRTFRWDVHEFEKDWVEYSLSRAAWIAGH